MRSHGAGHERETVVVSACLLGLPCRYDGRGVLVQEVLDACHGKRVLPMCPEVAAGMGVPRPTIFLDPQYPLHDAIVQRCDGLDVTGIIDDAIAALSRVVLASGAKAALLKEGSPSCGVSWTYHGPEKVRGSGRFARALEALGVSLLSEEDLVAEEHAH